MTTKEKVLEFINKYDVLEWTFVLGWIVSSYLIILGFNAL